MEGKRERERDRVRELTILKDKINSDTDGHIHTMSYISYCSFHCRRVRQLSFFKLIQRLYLNYCAI